MPSRRPARNSSGRTQSNLRLYGRDLAGAAIERGIQVGLGADWLPSGSPSLLAELKVARQSLIEEGHRQPRASSSG